MPEVLVEFRSGNMRIGAYALKARVIAALVNSAPFRDSGLDAGGVGAVKNFGSPVDMAVGE